MNILDNRTLGDRLAELFHRLLEPLAILRLFNRLERRSEELHAMLRQNALLGKLHGEVQPRLSAERCEQPVGLLLGDDLLQEVHRQWLDVDAVSDIRVRHDGRRVAVDEHDLQTVLLQRAARLRTGVVKLRRLTDDDGAGADDHDLL